MRIADQVVVVTGAGSGIGAALTRGAAARGAAAIAVVDIDTSAAARVSDQISEMNVRALPFTVDIADVDAVDSLAARVCSEFGAPGLVFANAGVCTRVIPLLRGTAADLNWLLSVNVVGTWSTVQSFARRMIDADRPGRFVITGSEHSLGMPSAGTGFYTMSKHAVLGMADVLRAELPPELGISVLVPGLTATGLSRSASHRPARFGGAEPDDDRAAAVLARGMDPGVVAEAALDGVEADQFVIASHAHARRYAEVRYTDVDAAFDILAAGDIPEESFELGDVVARVRAGR